ncbi:IclR family transcriptional regulator [Antarcticimicrobium luteum]|uniref:IclR family transcriptional regulator n=1 Tax=Antarcticimicrobium luteum TaxID=2547397 RepID=A0A4R5UWU4_9RHOB|nr:IclR family transcriptional regulator [Antarcticimicrobium luteum]TDK43749.1 IclR family transcriptional regulator [Antarcticimicrobium luteum]
MSEADKGQDQTQSGGIQSLDSALRLLLALAGRPGPTALSDLARDCAMPVSKAHRYLASFAHAGLVRQAGKSGKYDLGPAAVRLGLAAMARNDAINIAADGLPDLCAETGLTALLSVWGNSGPTVVRWERAANFMVTTLGLGSTLPVVGSATGHVFLAFLPRPLTAARVKIDRKSAPQVNPGTTVEQVRAAGYATVSGDLLLGLSALAAPVLDWQGEAQAVVTLIGTDAAITAPGSAAIAALTRYCADRSLPADPG